MARKPSALVALIVAAGTILVPVASAPPAAADETCSGPSGPAASFTWGCDARDFVAKARSLRESIRDEYRASSGHVVARFRSLRAARTAAAATGLRIRDEIGHSGAVVVDVPAGGTARGLVRALRARADVLYAELDHRVSTMAQTTDWGATAMNAPAAHTGGATGSGVTIAIADTGVDYTHEDLDANIWVNAGETADNGIDDDGNGYVDDVRGWDFVGEFFTTIDPDNDPMDILGHGTHVSGIVAAEDNATGVLGVAPDATIMPVKVFDDYGSAFDSTIADGMYYAVDNGADVINLSLGGYWPSTLMRDAAQYAYDNGVAVVAAAGNFFYFSIPSYPAGYPTVISVAAASREDESKTWWSDWGHADFLAPGEEVLSSTPDDEYQRFSGTSMASPHVAGALGLIKEVHPGFGPDELEQALASTADDRYATGIDPVSGAGFPDVDAATGTLPATQLLLSRAPYLIPSDDETGSTITLRALDADGLPVAALDGTFATDVGSLSDTAFTTDADGLASTTLTVEDHYGLATVTATAGALTQDVQVIVEDDRVRVNDAFVAPVGSGDYFFDEFASAGPGPIEGEEETPTGPVLEPGQDVQVISYIGNRRFGDPKDAEVSFSVTDPDGDPVSELAGDVEAVEVGFGGRDFGIWISEERVPSVEMTIPDDAAEGRYELTVTVTDVDSGLTDARTRPFWVGTSPEVLVVRAPYYFNVETFNYFDFTYPHMNRGLEEMLEGLGADTAYWDISVYGQPTARDLREYATVIWLADWDPLPDDVIRRYLRRGGNILVSSELSAGYDRQGGSSALYQNRLHLTGVYTQFLPHSNHQIFPAQASGVGPFAGETFDIDSYDLGTDGEPTAIWNDELVLQNAGSSTDSAFTWDDGVHDPAIAGVSVDTGDHRAIYTAFGIEAIDDDDSTMTVEELLDEVLTTFNPAPSITDVVPGSLTEAGGTFTIVGDDFQPTGTTIVKVGGVEVTATVLDRTTIEAELPYDFPRGLHNVRVTNPLGDTDVAVDALRVTRAAPELFFADPAFASNNRARRVHVYGGFFRPGADLFLNGDPIREEFVDPSHLIATIPAGLEPGDARLKVVNPDGRSGGERNRLVVDIRYGFTFNMGPGDVDVAVAHLERRLRSYGFFEGDVNRIYGDQTVRALKRYQRSRDLNDTGILNRATRRELNSTF